MAETPEEVARRMLEAADANPAQVMWLLPYLASALRAQYVAGLEKAAEMLNRQADGYGDASDYADEMAHAIRELAKQAKEK